MRHRDCHSIYRESGTKEIFPDQNLGFISLKSLKRPGNESFSESEIRSPKPVRIFLKINPTLCRGKFEDGEQAKWFKTLGCSNAKAFALVNYDRTNAKFDCQGNGFGLTWIKTKRAIDLPGSDGFRPYGG